jgi:hypothetical protein
MSLVGGTKNPQMVIFTVTGVVSPIQERIWNEALGKIRSHFGDQVKAVALLAPNPGITRKKKRKKKKLKR